MGKGIWIATIRLNAQQQNKIYLKDGSKEGRKGGREGGWEKRREEWIKRNILEKIFIQCYKADNMDELEQYFRYE